VKKDKPQGKNTQKRWLVQSAEISEFVFASDQFEAWDALRDRRAEDFGLIAKAEVNESGDPFLIRTSALMYRWGRDADGERFISRGMEVGMPDTTVQDKQATCK
jgi:hypothetical protein